MIFESIFFCNVVCKCFHHIAWERGETLDENSQEEEAAKQQGDDGAYSVRNIEADMLVQEISGATATTAGSDEPIRRHDPRNLREYIPRTATKGA